MSLSYSYSELLSCSWMLKQKRIFYSHTHAWMCPLKHTIITLTCRQAHHSSYPLSLQPLSAQHFLCPALSPLHPALSPPSPSPFRATSPLRSASPHCGSVIVVHGVLIYRLWVVVIYCVGIYYFIVLFTILDVWCIVKWFVKINKNIYFFKTLLWML